MKMSFREKLRPNVLILSMWGITQGEDLGGNPSVTYGDNSSIIGIDFAQLIKDIEQNYICVVQWSMVPLFSACNMRARANTSGSRD